MSDTPFETEEDVSENNRKRHAGRIRAQDDEFLRSTLKSKAGRDYFWRLLERCHIFEVTYVQGSFDATSFREGERSVGNRLLSDITRVSPDQYMIMMQERSKKPEPELEKDDSNAA